MVSSRIATQTTTTTTNGIVVATKKTKKVRFISVCFSGRDDGMLRRQRRSNPSSSLSRLARLSDFFFCACRCGAGAAMRSSSSFTSSRCPVSLRARFRVLTTSLVLVWSPPTTRKSHLYDELARVHKTHRSNPSNERRKQRRRSLP